MAFALASPIPDKVLNSSGNDGGVGSANSNANNADKININTANAEEFKTLSGIGDAKANAIVEYRQQNGNFTKIEDLTKVSGIGEATLAKIKDRLTT